MAKCCDGVDRLSDHGCVDSFGAGSDEAAVLGEGPEAFTHVDLVFSEEDEGAVCCCVACSDPV